MLSIADIIVENISSDKKISKGLNGPYNNLETDIRIYSHFLVMVSKALSINNNVKYKDALFKLTDKIHNSPHKGEFNFCYRETGKDKSNGLIGFAWMLEGIIASYEYISNHPIIFEIDKWIDNYEYSQKKNLYKNIAEPEKIIRITDFTVNHQIWFRSSIHRFKVLRNDNFFIQKIDLKSLFKLIQTNSEKNINHYPPSLKEKLRKVYYKNFRSKIYDDLLMKERGYHFFNLLGLIRGFENLNDQKIKEKINKLTNKAMLDLNASVHNKYGTPYNPVYLEAAITYDFLNDFRSFSHCINSYFNNYLDETFFINDKLSFYSRIYEICYINNNLNFSISKNVYQNILINFKKNIFS